MLLANETVAEEYFWRELPFLYRTHETPDEEKMRQLGAFINNFGYHIIYAMRSGPRDTETAWKSGGDAGRADDQQAGAAVHETGAVYDGEYGAFRARGKILYSFYIADPTVSGSSDPPVIKENLRGRLNEERISHYEQILPEVAAQCSSRERTARRQSARC